MTLKYFAGFSDGAVSTLFLFHIFKFTWTHNADGIFITVMAGATYALIRIVEACV